MCGLCQICADDAHYLFHITSKLCHVFEEQDKPSFQNDLKIISSPIRIIRL